MIINMHMLDIYKDINILDFQFSFIYAVLPIN